MTELTPFEARRLLNKAPKGKHFRLHMGADIETLEELGEALELMTDDSYNHHISETKNDFSNWVKEVVKDHTLAKELVKAKDRKDMQRRIMSRLVLLKAKAKEGRPISSQEWMRYGKTDFLLGLIVGFVIGLIVAVVL